MSNQKKYKPISCVFHEELLAFATLKKCVEIIYTNNNSTERLMDVIVDVYTKKGEEFILLSRGKIIRLDFLISVGGKQLPKNSCTF